MTPKEIMNHFAENEMLLEEAAFQALSPVGLTIRLAAAYAGMLTDQLSLAESANVSRETLALHFVQQFMEALYGRNTVQCSPDVVLQREYLRSLI